ncbi:MAG: hypothetical protein H6736_02845 [Alphaproteobacteria bacterium]|nr:hypothetical protein [Alphaproteobacteria bacterium]MCB9690731.1 hypothetical protein [Alphaproteobacteria bacterium]
MTDDTEHEARSPLGGVLLAWMISGAVLGVAAGLTAQLTGQGTSQVLPALCLAGMTTLGLVAWTIDRRLAEARPAVLDARGHLGRPPHALVYAIPLLAAAPALLVLVVVGSVGMKSFLPALVFGVGGFGLGWAARRLVSSHRLTEALQALEAGEVAVARERLEALESGWISTRRGRTTARLNLGMLALGEGDLERAGRWYLTVDDALGQTFARAGLALVRVLEDRLDEAERVLHEALASPGSSGVQGQLDAVRLLLTLRQEGPEAAAELGVSLEEPHSGELFRGLLALALLRAGRPQDAARVADPALLAVLDDSGWRAVIPEIAELLAEPA